MAKPAAQPVCIDVDHHAFAMGRQVTNKQGELAMVPMVPCDLPQCGHILELAAGTALTWPYHNSLWSVIVSPGRFRMFNDIPGSRCENPRHCCAGVEFA